MVITVNHNHSIQRSKEIVQQYIDSKSILHADIISSIETKWTDNRCDIKLTAKKMRIKGNISLEPLVAIVELQVPFLLSGFRTEIKKITEKELNQIFFSK